MSKKHLSGAFSPFTIALQNIRDNLLAKKNSEDIRYAYLQEIITLGIPIHTETKDGSTALEFPVAACWENKPEDEPIFRYAGQYTPRDHGDSKETKEKIKKAQLITPKIRNKINEEKMRRFKGPEIVYENAGCPFAGSVTDYPESLRKIKGCWKLNCDDLKFLIFFSYASDLPENSTNKDERKQIRKLFKSCFLAKDSYRYLSRITAIKPNEYHEDGEKDKKGYPVLRDLLSNIQRTIDIIAKPDKGKGENSTKIEKLTLENELAKIFGVVFVLPTIMDQDDKVGFRYILTHRQIRFFEEPGAAERIDSLMRDKEKEVLQRLWESYENCCPNTRIKTDCFGEDSSKQLKALINNLRDNLNYDGYGKINEHKRDKVKELLRKAIYAYYAFAPKTKTELNHEMFGGGIAEYIESDRGTVRYEQAFLIRHIFSSRSPDVVENFINHPLSKVWKQTKDLSKYMEDDSLYPRALHLLETIFFPKRLFMYPLYQHETPVLLCAFNADFYLESRQSLKSILDRHIQGIFGAILNYELEQANESFASMTSWSDTEMIGQSKRQLRQLLLRFCQEIEKIENIELREKSAADVGSVVGENKGWEFKVSSTTRISLRDDKEQPLRVSPDGRRVLDHYTKLYEETVARFREIVELSSDRGKSEEAESQTLRWAHAIKTELGEISMISEVIAPTGEPISNEPNISLYIESLRTQVAILSNSVGSLKNRVNALQLSASINIEDYIKAEASKEDLRWVMFDALQIAFLNLLLSTKRECSDKRSRWFKPEFIRGNSSYNKEEFGIALRNISLLKYKGDNSVSELISQMDIVFNRNNHNQAEYPLKIADFSFKFSIPSSGDKYYPNILVIILSEVIFNALKYTDEDVEIGIEENNSYNFISVKNPFSRVKSGTDIGISLVRRMSERLLRKSELSEFTYGNNGERVWIFKMPVYKCESKQTDQWGSYV